jgi:hypothetical protein
MARSPKWRGFVSRSLADGLLAGIAGGTAEILWIWAYAGPDSLNVARGVADVVGIPGASPIAGLGVHMSIALALGIALVAAWRGASIWRGERISPFAFMLTALAIVWGLNFLLVLPAVGPAFVALLPYPVSLFSKLLFGLAAAAVPGFAATRAALQPTR